MRTVDHFMKSLSRLNDKKFFEISRNVLGDVKTPYHRQTVIGQMVSRVADAALQEVLFSYITEDETLIINVVELFDGPSLHDIHDFLSSRFSYTECIKLVTLLEERLVLYSYGTAAFARESYALNPLFAAKLRPILNNKSALFPCVKKSGMRRTEPPAFTINKRFLFAFFSYVHSGKVRLKADNTLTKKAEDQATAFFQDSDFFNDYFFDLLDTSIYFDLLSIEEKIVTVNLPALEPFFKLSDIECRAYFAAAMSGTRKFISIVRDMLASLSPETHYTPSTIHGVFMIVLRKSVLDSVPQADRFLGAMKKMELLIETEDPETGEKYCALPPDYTQSLKNELFCSKDDVPSQNDTPSQDDAPSQDDTLSQDDAQSTNCAIVFDSPFSFVLLPNADIASAFDLIHFSSVENIREYRFTISRDTVARCLETGADVKGAPEKNAAWIIERLKTLSDDRLDETLVWTVNEWEKRFGEVILHEGLVLYLNKERRYLAETASLKPYLEKALTEGVFIINPVHRETVGKLLAKSGVDIIGNVPIPVSPPSADTNYGRSPFARTPAPFLPLSKVPLHRAAFSPAFFIGEPPPHEAPPPAVDYREKFKALLASLDTAEAERQELLLRIDRGLIFSEEQLKKLAVPGTFPYEKNKAHGMDYAGKLIIAKSAFVNGTPVEITWQSDDKEKSLVCTIAHIERRYSGEVLILSKDNLRNALEIPLGKVSLIKRIKQSIFD